MDELQGAQGDRKGRPERPASRFIAFLLCLLPFSVYYCSTNGIKIL